MSARPGASGTGAARPARPPAPLFEPGETVEAGRVRLSALESGSLEALAPWLDEALAPEWRHADLLRALESASGVLIADAAGAPIGCAVAVLQSPERGSASVPFLAVEPSRRYRGLGGEAGIALDRHLRRRLRIARLYAPVPDGRGLAVYFWLRLGLRPLTSSESPGPVVGLSGEPLAGIWMMREETEDEGRTPGRS